MHLYKLPELVELQQRFCTNPLSASLDMFPSILAVFATFACTYATAISREEPPSPLHLAVGPKCATSLTGAAADVNAGLKPLNQYSTIVTFGDAYTDNGVHNGSQPGPASLVPPSTTAGGRPSNGPVWAEYLANAAGARLRDYAVNGALVDATQYPGTQVPNVADFNEQANTVNSGGSANRNPSDSTLYVVFFGIGDYEIAKSRGESLSIAAQNIAYNIWTLTSSPTYAKNILIVDNYGRGETSQLGEDYKAELFSALEPIRRVLKGNVGFVDLSTLWKGVLGSNPGYQAFGYTNPGSCLPGTSSTSGACADPARTFYWTPGLPTTATHKLISDYVQAALTTCKI
ncbi:carbohydrate esterase family 16 protein [Panaeolus papilionaceus]|nr:carbohydrate esterase family 16 protein [Panaeolus papilionaceus]